jgi:hypothetical protein
MADTGWRPIETAPKDGTAVLLFRQVGPWSVRGWGRWVRLAGVEGWLSYGFYDPPGNLGLAGPSHWAPIINAPPPPEPSNG